MMKNIAFNHTSYFKALLCIALLTPLNFAFSFAYIFANESNGVDLVTHPSGYNGSGGTLTITVGIDPISPNAADMVISTQNVISVFNNMASTTPNISFGSIPSQVDFESVLLHEMGHSLGLAHCNLATESGLSGSNQDYTKTTDGANDTFDLNPGLDGVIGSADDVRGDDENLNYFKISDNNPFTITSTVDQTTYSRDLLDLPSGNFSANGERDVSVLLGFNSTEAVMQQGSIVGEVQRTLAADDVAGLKYGEAGVDEIAGTIDDYTLVLNYVGLTDVADIVIAFDDTQTGFAVSQSGADLINANHAAITSSRIYFNTGYNWFFNTSLSVEDIAVNTSKATLFPNPTNDFVSISNSNAIERIAIYDINGRLIQTKQLDSNNALDKITIDISDFESGIYLFVIKSDNGQQIERIIKN
ncbi:zinc-dependent metalloprotease [Psychroserpens sp. S379A]|uniref:T9SS type A sorting domain-containing protein n=1 Tax=Psychroserpens sp. S379A TaxID=3415137 RepID=UPI003C7BA96E